MWTGSSRTEPSVSLTCPVSTVSVSSDSEANDACCVGCTWIQCECYWCNERRRLSVASVIMNHELIKAERRKVPEGEVMFVFVFDPEPGGTGTLGPPTALCGDSARVARTNSLKVSWSEPDLRGSILTWRWRAPQNGCLSSSSSSETKSPKTYKSVMWSTCSVCIDRNTDDCWSHVQSGIWCG